MICVPVIAWGLFRTIRPPVLLRYSKSGISFPNSQGTILWRDVIAVEVSQMKVGINELGQSKSTNLQSSVTILFSENINLIVPKIQSTHGRLLDGNSYIFTTGVIKESSELIVNEINLHLTQNNK